MPSDFLAPLAALFLGLEDSVALKGLGLDVCSLGLRLLFVFSSDASDSPSSLSGGVSEVFRFLEVVLAFLETGSSPSSSSGFFLPLFAPFGFSALASCVFFAY